MKSKSKTESKSIVFGVSTTSIRDLGKQIVVTDNGFFFVGNCTLTGDMLTISKAYNIRILGTTKGMGELSAGPTKETLIDWCGTILVPAGRVIFYLKTVQSDLLWTLPPELQSPS